MSVSDRNGGQNISYPTLPANVSANTTSDEKNDSQPMSALPVTEIHELMVKQSGNTGATYAPVQHISYLTDERTPLINGNCCSSNPHMPSYNTQ